METPLDRAFRDHHAMPDDEKARLRFHERLLDAELVLLLREEVAGGTLKPEVFALETGPVALVFDRDDRLAAFLEAPAAYAALSGRRIVAMLAEQGIGLGLNLGVAVSSTLLPAETVAWLAAMAAEAPVEVAGRFCWFAPPGDLPRDMLEAVGIKLASMTEVIGAAYLLRAGHDDGTERALLALIGVPEAARADVARAVAEAVRFSGVADGALEVVFMAGGSAAAQSVARVGARLELPRHAERPVRARDGPGMDRERPPILR